MQLSARTAGSTPEAPGDVTDAHNGHALLTRELW